MKNLQTPCPRRQAAKLAFARAVAAARGRIFGITGARAEHAAAVARQRIDLDDHRRKPFDRQADELFQIRARRRELEISQLAQVAFGS